MKELFVTGMFRSGTTLLGKCLGAHPEVALALDSMRGVLREVRNRAVPSNLSIDKDAPFGDNFWDDFKWKFSTLFGVDLESIRLSLERELEVIDESNKVAQNFSPELAESIGNRNKSENDNIKDLISFYFKEIRSVYGGELGVKYSGTKEVWAEDFAPIILKNFPEARVVHIIRDPRGVVASKMGQETHYPLLFLSRFWRKSVVNSVCWSELLGHYGDRYHVIRFEDLIRSPETELRAVSNFLGIEYSHDMLNYQLHDPESSYGTGANSSFDRTKGKSGFASEAVDRWKSTLTRGVTRFVEALCFPEAKLLGYDVEPVELKPEVISNPPEIASEDLDSWLEPYEGRYLDDRSFQRRELRREQLRRLLLEMNRRDIQDAELDEAVQKTYFHQAYFDYLREHIKTEDDAE